MPDAAPPNVLHIHSHDTGRHIEPYGHPVPTPNLQRLPDQGILFRRAFANAATCSGSRAAVITGRYPHRNGMMGLAHRGWRLHDYGHHLLHALRTAGYHSAAGAVLRARRLDQGVGNVVAALARTASASGRW